MNEPLLLSTWSFALEANRATWPLLAAGGTSLDAVEHVCRHVEEDTGVDSVGLGGLPNAAGDVTLDACIMLSPAQSGSVCAVSTHPHVTSIARAVMERTPHVMLVGDGATQFAKEQGFPLQNLMVPDSEAEWKKWLEKAEYKPVPNIENHDRGNMINTVVHEDLWEPSRPKGGNDDKNQ